MKINKYDLSPIDYLSDSLDRRGIRQNSLNKIAQVTTLALRTFVAHNIRELVLTRAFTRHDYWHAIQI